MKNKNLVIGLIVFISLFIISLIVFMFININSSPNIIKYMFSSGISDKLAITKTYKKDFDVVNINSTGANIYIKHIDSDEFIVNVYGDKDKVEVKASDNQLYIDIDKKNFMNKDLYKIVVYLPFTYDRYVFIDSEYGDINISNFDNTNFEIDLDYGNIYVDSSNRLEIDSKIGDISIGNSNYIDIKSSISRIDIDEIDELVIDNNIGNIVIKKVNNYIDINNDIGNIDISNISIDKNSKLNLNIGDININYINNTNVNVDNFIGKVVNDNKDKSKYKFIINNKIGNIKIKHSE